MAGLSTINNCSSCRAGTYWTGLGKNASSEKPFACITMLCSAIEQDPLAFSLQVPKVYRIVYSVLPEHLPQVQVPYFIDT